MPKKVATMINKLDQNKDFNNHWNNLSTGIYYVKFSLKERIYNHFRFLVANFHRIRTAIK